MPRTGLTIPLQITLSDIKLSGFIILVFSRQKGITLVFRNDPLESLKVSSTFDSIPFVRDHLQKEIEGQLRILLMDELPAIIHRLSLRLWVPEYSAGENGALSPKDSSEDAIVDPFSSPPQDPVDSSGNVLNPAEIASLSLDSSVETHSLFSRKNLLRLATLTDSHRTLSLFTPPIRDVVFRAWAGPIERGEFTGIHTTAMTPALPRTQSYSGGMSTAYTFSDSGVSSRSTPHGHSSTPYGLSMGVGRHSKVHGARKRKKRVVNLRKMPETGELQLVSEDGSTVTDSASVTESTSSAPSVFSPARPTSSGDRNTDIEATTPPLSPVHSQKSDKMATSGMEQPVDLQTCLDSGSGIHALQAETAGSDPSTATTSQNTLRPRPRRPDRSIEDLDATPRASVYVTDRNRVDHVPNAYIPESGISEKAALGAAVTGVSRPALPNFLQFITDPSNSGSIAEQAWMTKMAAEVARKYEEERQKGSFGLNRRDAPPPAYTK